MNIFIELPTWLGDALMTTPAIENLTTTFPNATITLGGSYVSIEALKYHPKVKNSLILEKNYLALYRQLSKLEEFDIAFSFRSSFRSKIALALLKSDKKFQYNKKTFTKIHQVEKYNNFINNSLSLWNKAKDLKLYIEPKPKIKALGINPGATYGSAKRWDEEKFAKVAKQFCDEYEIVLFGSKNELEICNKIEALIDSKKVKNLAGKTDIKQLCQHIGSLSFFVTNDSGPMHIAAAYKIPTLAIFGPTKPDETNQWQNPNSFIIKKNLSCMPCMKRECPIKTHECMKEITPDEVISKILSELLPNLA